MLKQIKTTKELKKGTKVTNGATTYVLGKILDNGTVKVGIYPYGYNKKKPMGRIVKPLNYFVGLSFAA